MYIKSMRGWLRHIDFILLDIIILELVLFLGYGFCYHWSYVGFWENYQTLVWLLALSSLLEAAVRSSYHEIMRRGYLKELKFAAIHVTMAEIVLVLAAYFLQLFEDAGTLLLIIWAAGIVLCWAVRCLWKVLIRQKNSDRTLRRQVLLVTAPEMAARYVAEWKEKKSLRCELCGICMASNAYAGTKEIGGVPVAGDLHTIWDYIQGHVVDEVLVQPGHILDHQGLDRFIRTGLMVHMDVEDLAHFSTPSYLENFAGMTVFTSAMRLVNPWELWVKRLIDIVGACAGLLLTGIACIFLVPAIKIQDPGPVFFAQTRVGRNGRKFRIYKFRSMYQNAEAMKEELVKQTNTEDQMMFKMEWDPRIIGTKKLPDGTMKKGIGNFIRDFSLDELPQFFNVLKGDMSLVGTRPPTLDEWERYEPHHRARMSMRPGITGLWQVSGRSSITDFEKIVELDKKYICEWTLGEDFKILLKTIAVVFKKDGAM